MPFKGLGAFALTCLIIELTPGPNMAYLAVLAASYGRRAGFVAALGVASGLLLAGMGAALGLAAVISNSRVLFEALRWAGVAYLAWLAWDGWRGATDPPPNMATNIGIDGEVFRRGLISNLLNPKAAVFYVAVLPTFVDPNLPVLWQTLVLSLVYVSIATAIHVAIVAFAGTAAPFLEDLDRRRKVRRALSVLLGVIAIWFAFSSAR
jgi:threonine/homoserine/homoserine lactone efflux protein